MKFVTKEKSTEKCHTQNQRPFDQSFVFHFFLFFDFFFHNSIILCFLSVYTGKSLSEALILASTNPQYDDRLFIELQVQYMKISKLKHGENMLKVFFLIALKSRSF